MLGLVIIISKFCVLTFWATSEDTSHDDPSYLDFLISKEGMVVSYDDYEFSCTYLEIPRVAARLFAAEFD